MQAEHGMFVRLLGVLELTRDGQAVPVGGVKQRIVLAALALEPGRVVSVDHLAEAVWGDPPPPKAAATLQVYASNLRKLLGPTEPAVLRWQRPGYVLDVDDAATDIGRFTALTREANGLQRAGQLAAASDVYGAALALWRGPALADLADEPFARATITRLHEARTAALEERAAVDLTLGHHSEVIAATESVVAEHPLRERAWALLMSALYQAGRQSDALAAYQRVRTELADQLGLDPGSELQRMERDILAQAVPTVGALTRTGSQDVTVRGVDGNRSDVTAWLALPDGQRLPLTGSRMTVGRDDSCDVVLSDPRVSRRHAIVRLIADIHQLIDTDSTNGTLVNGVDLTPRTPHSLAHGDEISLGGRTLRYERPR